MKFAQDRGETHFFDPLKAVAAEKLAELRRKCTKARSREVDQLAQQGFGMHNAGMVRPDRLLTEQLFLDGALRVICCTATLAWGVNLPARCVVIKGTSVYTDGGFKDLGILDVLQIFGRAGRPQFDDTGEAVRIESQLSTRLPNALNAEICLGTVQSERDAAAWLEYTYMYVHMFKAPQAYGLSRKDFLEDPDLMVKRLELVGAAAQLLNNARLIRVDARQNFT